MATTKKETNKKTEGLGDMATIGAAGGIDAPEKPLKLKEIKRQRISIKLSVYRDDTGTILSAIGIPSGDTIIEHVVQKSKVKKEVWFTVMEFLQNKKVLPQGTENRVIKDILNLQKKEIVFPPMVVSKLPQIADWVHEILNIEIEL